jgi:alkane 1-monooxygenase
MLLAIANFSPKTMRRLRAVMSILPLTLPLLAVRTIALSRDSAYIDWWMFYPLLIMYGALTLLDYLVGRDTANTEDATTRPVWLTRFFQVLPLICVPLHFALLFYAAHFFVTAPLSAVGMLGWILSIGVISGIVAINVAHELIHKPTKLEQCAGGMLLSACAYGSFKIEHVMGHHLWVATDRDPSSAKQGESIYAFVPRAVWRNLQSAVHLQLQILHRKGVSFWSWRNELLCWSALTIGLSALFGALFGALGVVFFVGQALVAIINLELINYIEHYGLRRENEANGRPSKVTPMHSWNSAYFLTNAYLFQLQRHSDHHAAAGRRYQDLRHFDASPQLPGGYGAMILLSLIPPLWRYVIDKRIPKDFQWQT